MARQIPAAHRPAPAAPEAAPVPIFVTAASTGAGGPVRPGGARKRGGSRKRGGARDRLAGRGRGGLFALGAAAALAVAAALLTQFLTSPAAQTTVPAPAQAGSAAAPGRRPAPGRTGPAANPPPSADATSSVLASASPPPMRVLGQIRATLRRGAADGQIRQDVVVDIGNLIQPIESDLIAGHTGQVPGLVAALRAKLATRLSEGAITASAGRQLSTELTTLLRGVSGR